MPTASTSLELMKVDELLSVNWLGAAAAVRNRRFIVA